MENCLVTLCDFLCFLRHKFGHTNVELVKSTLMNYYDGEVLQGGLCPKGILSYNISGGILSRGDFVQGGLCPGFAYPHGTFSVDVPRGRVQCC